MTVLTAGWDASAAIERTLPDYEYRSLGTGIDW